MLLKLLTKQPDAAKAGVGFFFEFFVLVLCVLVILTFFPLPGSLWHAALSVCFLHFTYPYQYFMNESFIG